MYHLSVFEVRHIALKMLKKDMSVVDIVLLTDLSIKQIQGLQSQQQ